MKQRWQFRLALIAVLVAFGLTGVACGSGGGLEGTYSTSAGNVVLELRFGGKANFTIMGETQACTWKAGDSKVVLTCKGDSVDFVRHDDGSLSGPGFVGRMTKSKA